MRKGIVLAAPLVVAALVTAGCSSGSTSSTSSAPAASEPAASAPAAGEPAASAPAASPGTYDEPKQYQSAQEVIDAYPTTALCGTDDLKLAFPAGITNAWMKQTYQMILNEAAKCPNVTFQIVDAQVDQQKAVSDVNSLVAQGVDGIVTLPIFGAAQIPSFKNALEAGVPVVTFIADSGGEAGTDVTAHVTQDLPKYGAGWADWLNANLKKGTVIFLGNAPGQPSSVAAFGAFKTALEGYPDLKLVESDFVPTNNDAVVKKQAMTAMLAKHGCIDAVVTDNGAIDSSVIEAYNAAKCKLPYLANANTTNGLGCVWEKANFPLYSWDGSNDEGVVAMRRLLSAVNNIWTTEPLTVEPFVSVDSVNGIAPKCDPSVSPDVDWSTGLPVDQLQEILK